MITMTKEEIIRYYHLLGYYYETLLGALYARKMVSDHLAEKCRKDFYDRLAQEKELHLSVCISMISEDAVRVRSQVKAVQKESNIDRWMGNEHVSQLLSMAWI